MDGDRPQEQDGGGAEAYARGGAATLLTIKGKEKDRSREIGTKGEVDDDDDELMLNVLRCHLTY